jgi:uncharacterized membrane protein YjjP (DUF1212 family)
VSGCQQKITAAQDAYADIGLKIHLLLETGRLLMESRATTNRITRDLQRAAAYMGIPEEKTASVHDEHYHHR